MPLQEIGAFLLALIALFLFGSLWFHLVEAILGWIKKSLNRHGKPPVWHPYPTDREDKEDKP